MKRGMWRMLLVGLLAVFCRSRWWPPGRLARRIRSRVRCRFRAVSAPRSDAPVTGSRTVPRCR